MSEHEAPSAIMWAVKGPDGVIDWTIRKGGESAPDATSAESRKRRWGFDRPGYRCIRVKVTEVGDA